MLNLLHDIKIAPQKKEFPNSIEKNKNEMNKNRRKTRIVIGNKYRHITC